MKKIIVLLMVAILLIAVSACKKNVEPAIATEAVDAVVENVAETNTAESTEATEVMIEYSLPQGEGVEALDEPENSGTATKKETESTKSAAEATEATKATESTEPTETDPEKETTPAEENQTDSNEMTKEPESCNCEYYQYLQMSAAEQEAYMNSFASPMAFIEWSKSAMAEHEAHDDSVQASGGDLDISEFIQ